MPSDWGVDPIVGVPTVTVLATVHLVGDALDNLISLSFTTFDYDSFTKQLIEIFNSSLLKVTFLPSKTVQLQSFIDFKYEACYFFKKSNFQCLM